MTFSTLVRDPYAALAASTAGDDGVGGASRWHGWGSHRSPGSATTDGAKSERFSILR